MYGYFDESIITVDGVKYLFLGFIVFKGKQSENIILREFARTRSKLRNQKEIKYSSVRDSRIKETVLQEIKKLAIYFTSTKCLIDENNDTHQAINRGIKNILSNYFEEEKNKIDLLYDRVSYKIEFKDFKKEFSPIKSFDFGNSKSFPGIQYADWIAGEASEKFKQKNRQ